MKYILILIIRIYQRINFYIRIIQFPGIVYTPCKFHPTCSEYAKKSIEEYGAARGSWLAINRIIRCNPWSIGGVDYPKI